VVYDALADEQDTDRLSRVARDLSAELDSSALAVPDHDDSELGIELSPRGTRILGGPDRAEFVSTR
jgi:hypothetical protein